MLWCTYWRPGRVYSVVRVRVEHTGAPHESMHMHTARRGTRAHMEGRAMGCVYLRSMRVYVCMRA